TNANSSSTQTPRPSPNFCASRRIFFISINPKRLSIRQPGASRECDPFFTLRIPEAMDASRKAGGRTAPPGYPQFLQPPTALRPRRIDLSRPATSARAEGPPRRVSRLLLEGGQALHWRRSAAICRVTQEGKQWIANLYAHVFSE